MFTEARDSSSYRPSYTAHRETERRQAEPDPALVQNLVDMGFSEERA